MITIQNTVYVMTPQAWVHVENSAVRVDVDHKKCLQVPLHHVGGLVCYGNVLVSTALMHQMADEGKSVVFLDERGRFKLRLEGPTSGNVLLRIAQHRAVQDAFLTLELARACVAGKLRNCRSLVLRGAREETDAEDAMFLERLSASLGASLRAAARTNTLDELRGVEGEAARNYFQALNRIIKKPHRAKFYFDGRTRRPPRDCFNALLSFLYSMLMNDCRSALEATGLDPQIGFLHAVRPGRASLALDLQEEFRAMFCDRFALTLINRGQVSDGDFEPREGGAVLLSDKGRRKVVAAWQERKSEELTHPLLDRKMPLGLVPFVQARMLARTIRGEDQGYLPYLTH